MELIPERQEVASSQICCLSVHVCVRVRYPPGVLSVTCWKFSEAQVLHGSGGDKWLLRIVQDVSQCIHAHVEVGDVDTHRLFSHSRLVGVPGRLGAQQRLRDLDRVGLVPDLRTRSDWHQSRCLGSTGLRPLTCPRPRYQCDLIPDLWTRLYPTGV